MLGLKLNYVSKRGPGWCCNVMNSIWIYANTWIICNCPVLAKENISYIKSFVQYHHIFSGMKHANTYYSTMRGSGIAFKSMAAMRLAMVLTWWRHRMQIFSAVLALCERNPPVTGKRWCFLWSTPKQMHIIETSVILWPIREPSRSLWRHCNAFSGQDFLRNSTLSWFVLFMRWLQIILIRINPSKKSNYDDQRNTIGFCKLNVF